MFQKKPLFNALIDFYERESENDGHTITRLYHTLKSIEYDVVINLSGTVIGIIPRSHPDDRIPKLEVPGITKDLPTICWGAKHTLLFGGASKTDSEKHKKYMSAHLSLREYFNHPKFDAVCKFFERQNNGDRGVLQTTLPPPDKENDTWSFAIRIDDEYVFDDGEISPLLDTYLEERLKEHNKAKSKKIVGQCLVCGDQKQIARLHYPRLQTGSPGGTSLVSFNWRAANSYNRSQSFNAHICLDCSIRCCQTINHLLNDDNHGKYVKGSQILFWADDNDDVCSGTFRNFLVPSEEVEGAVAEILDSLVSGKIPTTIGKLNTNFYIISLSSGKGRSTLEHYYCSDMGVTLDRMRQFFADFAVKNDKFYPTIWRICKTASDCKIPDTMPRNLLKAILNNYPYPNSILHGVLSQISRSKEVTPMQVAIIRAFVNRNFLRPYSLPEVTMNIDKDRNDVGYQLGRYLAMVYKLQKQVSPNINKSVTARFFSSMMAHPGNSFNALSKYAQVLLNNSEFRDRKGIYEQLLLEISRRIVDLPTSLNVKQQSMFALGYDHELSYYGDRNKLRQLLKDLLNHETNSEEPWPPELLERVQAELEGTEDSTVIEEDASLIETDSNA